MWCGLHRLLSLLLFLLSCCCCCANSVSPCPPSLPPSKHRYISKNIKLYELRHDGLKLSTHAQANFARTELAEALRRGPFQVNTLLGGYDEKTDDSSLYTMDYLGSLHKVNFGCQGYSSHFCLSIMDRDFEEDMSEEQAIGVIEHCIKELQLRFLPSQPNYIIKVIDKEGVRTVKAGMDPTDN